MKGEGAIILSKQNLVDAMQDWIDKHWKEDSPVVTDVSLEFPSIGGASSPDQKAVIKIISNKQFVTGKEP